MRNVSGIILWSDDIGLCIFLGCFIIF